MGDSLSENDLSSLEDQLPGGDVLPFALTENDDLKLTSQQAALHSILSPSFGKGILASSSCSNPPTALPRLLSSSMSCPVDGDSDMASSSHDLGSSSFLPSGSELMDSSLALSQVGAAPVAPTNDTSAHGGSFGRESSSSQPLGSASMGFSKLMEKADNRIERQGGSESRLPVLPEEASVSQNTQGGSEFFSAAFHSEPPLLEQASSLLECSTHSASLLLSSNIITPAASSPGFSPQLSEKRRLATLAGATARIVGSGAFRVSIDLPGNTTSIADVMDVIGNPDLLHLWCDAVTALVVTSSSEGARSAVNRGPPTRTMGSLSTDGSQESSVQSREYEGEWIEATTAQLLSPNNTSCIYSTARGLAASLGFPTYGKVSMFVERQRGHVGLTMGPFPGNVQVLHKIHVEAVAETGKVRIDDLVRIQREDELESWSSCGDVFDGLAHRLLLPKLDDYMDQVLSSMARLRFLIENGEVQTGEGGVFPYVEEAQGRALSSLEQPLLP